MTAALVTVFERLFEGEFATLDDIAISRHLPTGIEYIDQRVALDRWLLDAPPDASIEPEDAGTWTLHQTAYELLPEADTIVSGCSRHLRALLLEGIGMPRPTSMLRRRGVTDLEAHLVASDALTGSTLGPSLTQARERAQANGMQHVLLLSEDGLVVAAGPNPVETMAHWHNVEFAARIECLSLEEAALSSTQVTHD